MDQGIWFGCIMIEQGDGSTHNERHNYFWSGLGDRTKMENDIEAAMYKEYPASAGWGEVDRVAFRIDDATVRTAARKLGMK